MPFPKKLCSLQLAALQHVVAYPAKCTCTFEPQGTTNRRLLQDSLEIDAIFTFNNALHDGYFEDSYNSTEFASDFEDILEDDLDVVVSDSVIQSAPVQISDDNDLVDHITAHTNKDALITTICVIAGIVFCCFVCGAGGFWMKYENESAGRWEGIEAFMQRYGLDSIRFSLIAKLSARSNPPTEDQNGPGDGSRGSMSTESDLVMTGPVGGGQSVELMAISTNVTHIVEEEEEEEELEAGGRTLNVSTGDDDFVRQSTFEKNLSMHMNEEEPVMATVIQEMHSESGSPVLGDDVIDIVENAYLQPHHEQGVPSSSIGME